MGRGRRSLLDELVVLPWPVGLVVGVVGFLLIRHGIPAWFSAQDGLFAQALAKSFPFAPLAWGFLALCAMASLFSFLGARRKRQLLDTRTGLDSIAALGWRDFERLIGEAFRRQGYTVEETGLGGADGGIDLILRKNGRRVLVQCKKWKQQVGVSVVREMYGLLAHHGANEVRVATIGGYTPDAARFAQGKPITLIDGDTLLGMIRAAQAGSVASPRQRVEPVIGTSVYESTTAPECPRCGKAMVERTNGKTGVTFWGCSGYPACRGSR